MADYALEGMRASVRIYDGTPTTPQFITLPWCQADGRFPVNRPRPARNIRMNRGQLDSYAHASRGDDLPVVTPIPVTFTTWLSEQLIDDVLSALGNPYRAATWAVGAGTFVTAANTGASLLRSGAGNSFRALQVVNESEERRINFEWLFQGQTAGTRDRQFRHEECFVPPELLVVSEGGLGGGTASLSITYTCWGAITSGTAFTAGTDLTPAIT